VEHRASEGSGGTNGRYVGVKKEWGQGGSGEEREAEVGGLRVRDGEESSLWEKREGARRGACG
jgi:hypothetical protein